MNNRVRQRGRPSGLTLRKENLLLNAIRRGLSYKHAAALAGISYMTFNRWRKLGSKEDASPEFRHFCDRLERAEAEGADSLLAVITKAGKERDWKAAAWILERRHPDLYASPNRGELKDDSTKAYLPEEVITLEELKQEISPEQLEAIMDSSMRERKPRWLREDNQNAQESDARQCRQPRQQVNDGR